MSGEPAFRIILGHRIEYDVIQRYFLSVIRGVKEIPKKPKIEEEEEEEDSGDSDAYSEAYPDDRSLGEEEEGEDLEEDEDDDDDPDFVVMKFFDHFKKQIPETWVLRKNDSEDEPECYLDYRRPKKFDHDDVNVPRIMMDPQIKEELFTCLKALYNQKHASGSWKMRVYCIPRD